MTTDKHLIEAAPELLEALEGLVNFTKGREHWPEVKAAEAAIAKAKRRDKVVRMVVAGHDYDGPALFFCKVACNDTHYNRGDHYERAKKAAREVGGFGGPMVPFEESDRPELFGLFVWESATTYDIERGGEE